VLSCGQAGVPFAPKHAHLQLAGTSRSNSLHAAGDIGPLHLLLGRKTHLASLEGLDIARLSGQRADTLSGAVFEASPLVRQQNSYSVGIAASWVFSRSAKLVTVDE